MRINFGNNAAVTAAAAAAAAAVAAAAVAVPAAAASWRDQPLTGHERSLLADCRARCRAGAAQLSFTTRF